MKKALLCLALLSPAVVAEGVGIFGYVKGGNISIDDPDGETESASGVIPGLKVSFDLSRGSRLFFGYESLSTELSEGVNVIGQDVSVSSLHAGYEKRFAISRDLKLWLGAAASYNDASFEKRFSVDSEGYLATVYGNRTSQYFGVTFSADTYFELNDDWRLGLGAFADVPGASDGAQVLGLRLTVGRE